MAVRIRIYAVCRIELVASYKLRGGVENIYPLMLLKRQDKKFDLNEAAALEEAWSWLLRSINEERARRNGHLKNVRA